MKRTSGSFGLHRRLLAGVGHLLAAAALMAQADDRAAREAPDAKIRAFERTHGERVYLQGRPADAILLADGTVGYLLQWPPAVARSESGSPWVVISHPVRGSSTATDPVTGETVAVGTDADGTYRGFAWFMETVPDVEVPGGRTVSASLYETHPPGIEEGYAGQPRPSSSQLAAVQKWWADQDDWADKVRAADLAPHTGVISDCREADEATFVTVRGDETFQFLYRDRDRVTYEGVSASSPCDLLGQKAVVWTLPCGDDGPCIRKVEAIEGAAAAPRASRVESASLTPVPHGGVLAGCRETETATVVTLKGDGTFQFLYRRRDRVEYEGVRAESPCELLGRKVVVWTVPCGEDSPCIGMVQLVGGD